MWTSSWGWYTRRQMQLKKAAINCWTALEVAFLMRDLPASRETSSEMATWSFVRVSERFSTSVWHELPVRGGFVVKGTVNDNSDRLSCRPPRRASLYMTKKGLQRGDHEHLRTPHLATLLIHVNVYHHFCLEGIPVHRTLHSLPRPPTLQPSAFFVRFPVR